MVPVLAAIGVAQHRVPARVHRADALQPAADPAQHRHRSGRCRPRADRGRARRRHDAAAAAVARRAAAGDARHPGRASHVDRLDGGHGDAVDAGRRAEPRQLHLQRVSRRATSRRSWSAAWRPRCLALVLDGSGAGARRRRARAQAASIVLVLAILGTPLRARGDRVRGCRAPQRAGAHRRWREDLHRAVHPEQDPGHDDRGRDRQSRRRCVVARIDRRVRRARAGRDRRLRRLLRHDLGDDHASRCRRRSIARPC